VSYTQEQTQPAEVVATGPSGPRAGFGQRLGAYLLDGIGLGIINGVLFAALHTAGYAIAVAIGIGYFVYFEGSTGQTLGKRALGIRVVDFGSGNSIGYGRAFIRYIGRIVSAIPIFLGFFWMLWDKEKQTWHDKFANSVVVPVDAYPV
jgi:uncharacterized RDD family membrane protein YckC